MVLNINSAFTVIGLLAMLVVHSEMLESDHNIEDNATCTRIVAPCKDGLLIPLWMPQDNLSSSDRVFRSITYLIGMMYMFMGVSVISDRFASSIEKITTQERDHIIHLPNGKSAIISERIWNETVANLTLMALGSSTPEILLSIIEVVGNNFHAGDLGPSTIVGSAAYNLFIVTAICVYAVPTGESRKIKQLIVFFVTATWGTFAYIWLYIILKVISEGRIEVWEALLTFAFFFAQILTAYIADRKLLIYRCLPKSESENQLATNQLAAGKGATPTDQVHQSEESSLHKMIEDNMSTVEQLRENHPGLDRKTVWAISQLVREGSIKKTKSYYRNKNRRGSLMNIDKVKKRLITKTYRKSLHYGDIGSHKIFFQHRKYSIMENAGKVILSVMREGGNHEARCLVDYYTEDGTTSSGLGYNKTAGTLDFAPKVHELNIEIEIIDDDVFRDNQFFYVHLKYARLVDNSGVEVTSEDQVQLWFPYKATVSIIDDDHPGVFSFMRSEATLQEDIGEAEVVVCRERGGKGRVRLPFQVFSSNKEHSFEVVGNELIFEEGECQ